MLDLDTLAEGRAKTLNQEERAWRDSVWSGGFQKISQQMTDGEIVSLLNDCPSAAHLHAVVSFLETLQSATTEDSPFTLLTDEARRQSLSLSDWIRRLPVGTRS